MAMVTGLWTVFACRMRIGGGLANVDVVSDVLIFEQADEVH
jgi:hypothetical protein